MADDIYGIPPGGNNGAWTAKKWKGINHTLTWDEMAATVALGGWPKKLWAEAMATAAAESARNPWIYNTYKYGHFGLFQISRSAWPEFFPADNAERALQWTVPWENAKKGYAIYQQQGWKAWEGHTNGAYLAYLPVTRAVAERLEKQTLVHPNDEKGFWMSKFKKTTQNYILKGMNVSPEDLARIANEGLADAVSGGAGATADATLGVLGTTADAIDSTFGWMNDLWESLTTPAFWMRMAYGTTGVILIAGGLFLIVRNTSAGRAVESGIKSAAKTAASASPAGRVGGVITKNEMAAQLRMGGAK